MDYVANSNTNTLTIAKKQIVNLKLTPANDYYFNFQPSIIYDLEVFVVPHDENLPMTNTVYKNIALCNPDAKDGDVFLDTEITKWDLLSCDITLDINSSKATTDGSIESADISPFVFSEYINVRKESKPGDWNLYEYGVSNDVFKSRIVDTWSDFVGNPNYNIHSLSDHVRFEGDIKRHSYTNDFQTLVNQAFLSDGDAYFENFQLHRMFFDKDYNNKIVKISRFSTELSISIFIEMKYLTIPKANSSLNYLINN